MRTANVGEKVRVLKDFVAFGVKKGEVLTVSDIRNDTFAAGGPPYYVFREKSLGIYVSDCALLTANIKRNLPEWF